MKSGKSALSTARDSISSIPGLHLWLDGTDATTITISGGLISQWRDKSAVGNHLSQATGSLQPTMGTLSGKPAVFFDGTGRHLLSSPVAAMSGDNPFSAFIVWNKTHAVNTACRPFGWGGADQGGFVALFGSAAGSSLSSWSFGGTAGYQLGLQPNAEDYHIPHTTYLDGIVKRSGILRSTTECYRSGEYKVMTAAQASVSLTLNVLGWGWGYAAGIGYAQLPAAATSLNGHIGEILVFNTAVSSANRKVIENYLSKKWAINLQNYRTGTAPANAPVSSPLDIPDCSLWLDSTDWSTLYTSGAGAVTAVSSPLDVTGCRLWLDGADSSASSMTLTGSLIDVWKDKSGNGRDFSASSSARPTLSAASFYVSNSLATFNGSSTTLTGNAAAGTVLRNLSAYTVFTVLRTSSVAAGERLAFGFGAAGSVLFRIGQQDSRPFIGGRRIEADTLESVTSASGSLATVTTFIQTAVVNHSSQSLTGVRNGLVYGTDATYMGAGSTADVACIASVGTQSGGTYGFWNGDIAEVIVFGGVVSDADRARVEKYLSSKWSVPVAVHSSFTSALFNSGKPVGLWSDKSTAAQHVKTTGTGPIYTENLQGGKPGLFFDTVGSSLISTASRSTPVPCTILAVVKNLATTSSIGGVVCYGSVVNGGGNGGPGIFANGTTEYITDGSGVVAELSSDTSSVISALPKIITSQYTGANTTAGSKMFNNNVLEELSTGAGGPTLTSVCVEVGGRTGGSQPTRLFRGNIHEVITYDRAITEPERCSVERYLSEKWGIAISPPTCGHPDAQDWINRVYENRGSVSQSTANKINDLCYSIDAAGIRSKIVRLNLFCGNNLAACLVPLYRGASLSGAQYGPRTDTNVNFVEADYVEIAGLAGNGSNKYLNLGDPKTLMPSWGSHHLGVDTTSDNNNNKYWMGCFMNGAATGVFADYGSVNIYPRGLGSFGASGAQIFTASGNSAVQNYTYFNTGVNASTDSKLKLMSRLSSTNFTLYNNAIGGATLTVENGTFTTMPAAFNVFAAGYQNVTGGRPSTISNGYEPSASTFRGYTMGFGLTGAQVTAYTNIFNSFRDAMGRLDALTPVFNTPTAAAGGFTAQITNYDTNYTWAATTTLGAVTVSGSGFITVTGVAAATSSTTTITASRSGYPRGFAIVRAASLAAALTPTFGTPTATTDGFTVQISNYDAAYTWAGTATASGSVVINGSGLVTVTGVASNTSSTATITTTRTGYVSGSATVTATSLAASFSSTSVILSSTSNYTVPVGAKVIKIWSIGAGGSATFLCDGGGGTAGNAGVAAYTHGFISNTNVVVNGSIGQPVASVCDLSTAGGSTTLSNLSTVISPSISSIVGGGGGAGGFVADRASSGNLSAHTLWTNSTTRRDYVGVNAVITAAGGNATTHTYGKGAATGAGSAGAIVIQFLPATDLVLPFTGSGSFTIPAGYSSVKIWAVGGGGIGDIYCDGGPTTSGGYGGIAFKTWSVSSGQVITYSAGAALSGVANYFCTRPTNGNASTATLNSITITGSAGLGNGTNGSGSGGDGSGAYGSDVSSIYAAYATYSPSTPTYGLRGVNTNTAGLIGGIVLVKFIV